MTKKQYQWAATGDVNAFFGLMLDNIAGLVLTVSLLAAVFGFPVTFALGYMVPGTAIGVLVGDLLYFFLAIRFARQNGRHDVTAMPLGLDTPSTFGMVFFVLGPCFLEASKNPGMTEFEAATYTWHVGICAIFISGLFKTACVLGANWIRRVVPRAGLLGSLTAVALVIISFLPLLEILQFPAVGLAALAVILMTLIAQLELPLKIPGALGALIVGAIIFYVMRSMNWIEVDTTAELQIAKDAMLPTGWLSVFRFEWLAALPDSLQYLPVVLPFALATVVGGIDCAESAAAAGDDFDTRQVIGVEAIATLVASLCGGVIQTTPYIGHPAYKAMGGRAAYTLATALVVGTAGVIGYFGYLYAIIPKAAVYPILVFIGLEITAQSFRAMPRRHYAAVALACLPALAYLAMILLNEMFGDARISIDSLSPEKQHKLIILRMLSGGFIVTSVLWASALAALIDRKLIVAAIYFAIAGCCTFFGIIHSPLPDGSIFLPFDLSAMTIAPNIASHASNVFQFTAGYLIVSGMLLLWAVLAPPARMEDIEKDDGDEC